MIKKRVLNRVKKVFGHRYSKPLAELINSYGVRNRNGSEVTDSMIRHVCTGNKNHEIIELAILKAIKDQEEIVKLAFKEKEEIRKNIFKTKKSRSCNSCLI